jgi:hypothetical protein
MVALASLKGTARTVDMYEGLSAVLTTLGLNLTNL